MRDITLLGADRDGSNSGQEEILSLGVHLFNSSKAMVSV